VITARATVKEGKAGLYLAASAPVLEQARKEAEMLLYAVHRSADDPDVFWAAEIYADDASLAAHARPRCRPLLRRCSPS
jgi:quinol monooxygenase YgiN